MGGVALSSHISAARIFMGGGGGAGEGNNGGSQNAGDGGGIVLIAASEVRTTGSCGGLNVTANGESITTGSGNDGNSGGGAGGTVLFDVTTWDIASGCVLNVEANGGNGGDVTHSATHGAGGGGGMGAVIFSITEPTTNTTVNTISGNGGSNCTTCGNADNGAGTIDDGIIDNSTGPLPIELLSFDAYAVDFGSRVNLEWETASEVNNYYFTIERSQDGKNWKEIEWVFGAGNSTSRLAYKTVDNNPFYGTSYYRLKQTDYDGKYEYFDPQSVSISGRKSTKFAVYPNPTRDQLNIEGRLEQENIAIFNSMGQEITNMIPMSERSAFRVVLDFGNLTPGMYVVVVGEALHKVYKQ